MDNYIKVTIVTSKPGEKDLLIGLLSEQGYDGFEEEQMTLNAYIIEKDYSANVITEIVGTLLLSFESALIPATNWNAEWETNFKPVLVGSFCCIRASFHDAIPGVDHDIIITPRMSFGTGHHATTWLMIDKMRTLDFRDRSVLDFGTGTAVLAILAEKMGAGSIAAIDNDEWSILNAGENILENSCRRINIARTDRIEGDSKFEVILANINRHVLIDNMGSMAQHLATAGVLVMSGLLSGDKNLVVEAANQSGLRLLSESEREGWIVLEFVHN